MASKTTYTGSKNETTTVDHMEVGKQWRSPWSQYDWWTWKPRVGKIYGKYILLAWDWRIKEWWTMRWWWRRIWKKSRLISTRLNSLYSPTSVAAAVLKCRLTARAASNYRIWTPKWRAFQTVWYQLDRLPDRYYQPSLPDTHWPGYC